MALDGAQIQITVGADVAPLLSGMNQATAVVSSSADKMAASFARAGAASNAMSQGTRERMQQARVEVGALEGSTGTMALGFEHLAAASKMLAPLISMAFPVFAVVALSEVLGDVISKFESYGATVRKQAIESDNLFISATRSADAIEVQNLKLEDEIAKLEGRPARNTLAEALIESKDKADELGKSLQADIEKQSSLLSVDWTAAWRRGIGTAASLIEAGPMGALENIAQLGPIGPAFASLVQQKIGINKAESATEPMRDAVEAAQVKALAAQPGSEEHTAALREEARAYDDLAAKEKSLVQTNGLEEAQRRSMTAAYAQDVRAAKALREQIDKLNNEFTVSAVGDFDVKLKQAVEDFKETHGKISAVQQQSITARVAAAYVPEPGASGAVASAQNQQDAIVAVHAAAAQKMKELQAGVVSEARSAAERQLNEEVSLRDKVTNAVERQVEAEAKAAAPGGRLTPKVEEGLAESKENTDYENARKALEQRLALIKKYGEAEVGEKKITLERLGALDAEHTANLATKRAEGATREHEQDRAVAGAQIEATYTVTRATIESDEKMTLGRLANTKDQVAAIKEETQAKIDAATKLAAAETTKATAERNLPGQDPAKVIEADARIKTTAINLEADLVKIRADGEARQNEETMRGLDRRVVATAESANRELEASTRIDEEKARHHEISINEEVSAETAALNKWYAQQATVLNAEEAFVVKTYGKEGDEYARLIQKKEELDQQYAEKSRQIAQQESDQWQQVTQRMAAQLNATTAKLIMNEETWAQASKRIFDEVGTTFIQNSMKMIEQEVTAAATGKALQAGQILGNAKVAATAAAGAVAGIPIVGPVLAIIAGDATFAAVMALGAFQKGGMALATGPYILHEGEGVLTSRQTAALDRATNVTNNTGGARHVHLTQNIYHQGTSLTEKDFARLAQSAVRKGLLRTQP